MVKGFIVLPLILLAHSSPAKNLGPYGAIFPVAEEDIREVIFKRLTAMQVSGELKRHQDKVTARIAKNTLRPKPLGLTVTNHPTTYRVNPSMVVNQDIRLPTGELIAKAGTTINPFTQIHYSKTLIFFNGDDGVQVNWVKRHYQDYAFVKFILTGGDIKEAAKRFGRIYFDQGGLLSRKLEVQHVPAVVVQDGLDWKITEIGINDV